MSVVYYASHYLWHARQDKLFRMQRIGLDEAGRLLVSVETLDGEVRSTCWLGGLIVLALADSALRKGETFEEFRVRLSLEASQPRPLCAYHVPFFDLRRMEFTSRSRLVRL